MARTKVIAGNWKMNKTAAEAKEFFNEFLDKINVADPEVVICPTYMTCLLYTSKRSVLFALRCNGQK